MDTDAHIQVPPPGDADHVRAEVYRIRGETVSVGGTVEWIIATLASRFAQSTETETGRQWEDLKRHIMSVGVNPELQVELGAVAMYFGPRNLAAHAGVIIAGVAEAIQVFRVCRDGGEARVEEVTLDELRGETDTARAGLAAIKAIGRVLDDHNPVVLARMQGLAKAMLLGPL